MRADLSRRRLLRAAGAASVAATLPLAGCSNGLGRLGGGGRSGPGDYRQWLPAPAAVGGDRYGVLAIDVATAREVEDRLRDVGMWQNVERALRADGSIVTFDRGTVEQYFGGPGTVYTGSFDLEKLVAQANAGGFVEVDDHRELKLFQREGADDGYTFALSSSAVVFPREGGAAAAKRIIDTRNGGVGRYGDDPETGPLIEALELPLYVQAQFWDEPGSSGARSAYDEGRLGVGYTHDVDGDTTTTVWHHLYASAGAAAAAPIVDWVTQQSTDRGALDGYSDVTVERDGRIVSVSGTLPTDELEW